MHKHCSQLLLTALLATSTLIITACSNIRPVENNRLALPATQTLLNDELIYGNAPPPPLPDTDIAALNDEIRAMLDQEIRSIKNPQQRITALKKLIFSPDRLNMQYSSHQTQTAIQTFNSHKANCLSFSILFTAMARYVDLPTYYQIVDIPNSWGNYNNLWISNQHINTITPLRDGNIDRLYSDADRQDRKNYSSPFRPRIAANVSYVADINPAVSYWVGKAIIISDQQVAAHYYSNLAAESLMQNNPLQQTYQYARKSIELIPESAAAWNIIGIVYRRIHQDNQAEAVFKYAATLETSSYASLNNLAHLYDSQNRVAEAIQIRTKIKGYLEKNPYYHFLLGQQAYAKADFENAIRHIKRAIRIRKNEHLFYYVLARSFAKLHDIDKAITYLKQAEDYATTTIKARYTEKLKAVEATNRAL